MTGEDPTRLREGDDALAELFAGCDDDRVELDVEAALARHQALMVAGIPSVAPPLGRAVGLVSRPGLLLGGGLLTVVVGLGLGLSSRSQPEALGPAPAHAPMPSAAPETGAPATATPEAPVPREPDPELTRESAPVDTPIEPPPAAASPTSKPALRSGKRPSDAVAASEDALGRELELIAKARKALSSGDHATALATSKRSLAEFPRGTFAEEARALEILALVGLGRREQAEARAERFRALHPDSALDRRIGDALATP